MTNPAPLRIDFVSDIACPWCAIGLAGLEQALVRLKDTVAAEIHLQPFELDPTTPVAGVNADEHLKQKYGLDQEQLETSRQNLRQRAAAVGFVYNVGAQSRVYNTFAAHRLLHWASLTDAGKALSLKKVLFRAFFTDDENVSDPTVLVRLARGAGLDADTAAAVLVGKDYAQEVRAQERHYQHAGIHSVPATIIDRTYVIAGGQPPEAFEQALRQIADGSAWRQRGPRSEHPQ
ncbi:MAG TPA: DsbA family oxidoreductase [Nevskiaceae bacterium]|nr:DsbA family oxidoreductase [Nevskiaceae bacterium]